RSEAIPRVYWCEISGRLLRFARNDNARLRRLVEQLTPDQHAADLAGPGADLVQLGIPQQPSGRVVVDIPIPAETLDRLQRHPGRLLGGEQDRAGRVLARGAS